MGDYSEEEDFIQIPGDYEDLVEDQEPVIEDSAGDLIAIEDAKPKLLSQSGREVIDPGELDHEDHAKELPVLSSGMENGTKRHQGDRKRRVTSATPPVELKPLLGVILVGDSKEIERDVGVHRLIRQPRYFDEASIEPILQGRCFNCGKAGHRANSCTFSAREKPCYLCCQFGHEARDCPARECRVRGAIWWCNAYASVTVDKFELKHYQTLRAMFPMRKTWPQEQGVSQSSEGVLLGDGLWPMSAMCQFFMCMCNQSRLFQVRNPYFAIFSIP